MEVKTAISLKQYTTMQLGGQARFMAHATTVDDVKRIYAEAKLRHLPVFVLGGGSNVITRDEEYRGIILRNQIPGFKVIDQNSSTTTIQVGAGEVWDTVVERVVAMGLSGIEAMSGIPGTAGAAPVQNVGAYGQEIADVLVSLKAFDTRSEQVVTLSAKDCEFSYRHSIFRGSERGRYCILTITIKLYHRPPKPPFYVGLQRYLDQHNVTSYTPVVLRQAVLAIRQDKLPDPAVRPNAGSFFKNSLIEPWQLRELRQEYPDMPCYEMPGKLCKVPTGWLIEQAGLKGALLHGIRVHDKNALVLINESASSYADLAAAREEIVQTVYDKFHIQIVQEPLELTVDTTSAR